jgi:hypothetical protein
MANANKATGVQWNCNKEESELVQKIAVRAIALCRKHNVPFDFLSCNMDIEAAHCNGCPLDLEKLLNAPDFDFAHDIFGIARNINRDTGDIENCFLPRCALQEGSAA